MQIIAEQSILCREVNELANLWRPFLGVLLHLFQCRLLHQVPEIEQNITESIKDLNDVILMYILCIED
jgi:hypothetical protein